MHVKVKWFQSDSEMLCDLDVTISWLVTYFLIYYFIEDVCLTNFMSGFGGFPLIQFQYQIRDLPEAENTWGTQPAAGVNLAN